MDISQRSKTFFKMAVPQLDQALEKKYIRIILKTRIQTSFRMRQSFAGTLREWWRLIFRPINFSLTKNIVSDRQNCEWKSGFRAATRKMGRGWAHIPLAVHEGPSQEIDDNRIDIKGHNPSGMQLIKVINSRALSKLLITRGMCKSPIRGRGRQLS